MPKCGFLISTREYILPFVQREFPGTIISEKAMKSHVVHAVWCYIFGETAGEILNWSLLGVKGLMNPTAYTKFLIWTKAKGWTKGPHYHENPRKTLCQFNRAKTLKKHFLNLPRKQCKRLNYARVQVSMESVSIYCCHVACLIDTAGGAWMRQTGSLFFNAVIKKALDWIRCEAVHWLNSSVTWTTHDRISLSGSFEQ